MKKILLFIIIAALLAFASVYGYIHIKTRKSVDHLVALAQPFANITYKSINNPMDGSISVGGITINTPLSESALKIQSFEIRLPNLMTLLKLDEIISSGKILPKIQLKIEHIRFPLDQINFSQAGNGSQFDKISGMLAAAGCGDIERIDYQMLPDFGYTEVDGSIIYSQEYNDYSSTMNLDLEFIWHDLASYSVTMQIPNIHAYTDLSTSNAVINNFQAKLQDLGYNQQLIAFCAAQSGVSPDRYVEHHIEQLRNQLTQAKVSLSEEIYSAYKGYLSGPDSIVVKIDPENTFSFDYLDRYKPSDWAEVLGITVFIGNKKIDDLHINWDKNLTVQDLLTGKVVNKKEENETGAAIQKTYARVEPDALGQYVNSPIYLKTRLGKEYKGILVEVTGTAIIIETRFAGNMAQLPINLDQIAETMVLQ